MVLNIIDSYTKGESAKQARTKNKIALQRAGYNEDGSIIPGGAADLRQKQAHFANQYADQLIPQELLGKIDQQQKQIEELQANQVRTEMTNGMTGFMRTGQKNYLAQLISSPQAKQLLGVNNAMPIDFTNDREDIASYLGVSPETLDNPELQENLGKLLAKGVTPDGKVSFINMADLVPQSGYTRSDRGVPKEDLDNYYQIMEKATQLLNDNFNYALEERKLEDTFAVQKQQLDVAEQKARNKGQSNSLAAAKWAHELQQQNKLGEVSRAIQQAADQGLSLQDNSQLKKLVSEYQRLGGEISLSKNQEAIIEEAAEMTPAFLSILGVEGTVNWDKTKELTDDDLGILGSNIEGILRYVPGFQGSTFDSNSGKQFLSLMFRNRMFGRQLTENEQKIFKQFLNDKKNVNAMLSSIEQVMLSSLEKINSAGYTPIFELNANYIKNKAQLGVAILQNAKRIKSDKERAKANEVIIKKYLDKKNQTAISDDGTVNINDF